MAKVSIIVPIYNVQDYLRECVDSLRSQTFEDIQIILVDDGSTDGCGQIIDSFAAQDARILALHKENGGQSSARNLGLLHATGEYILYVDADDYIIAETVETLFSTAKKHDADIVQGDLLNDAERLKDSTFRKLSCEDKKAYVLPYIKEVTQKEIYDIVPFLYLVKKEYILQHQLGFAEGYFYEDQLYTLQLLSQPEASIVKIRFPFYFYRMDRPGSTTNHITQKKGLDAAYICNQMYAYIHQHIAPENKQYYDAVLLISLYQYYRVYLRIKHSDRKQVLQALDLKPMLASLGTNSYRHLSSELHTFISKRRAVEMKCDAKRFIRKLLRR